jgi:hypothetical protein
MQFGNRDLYKALLNVCKFPEIRRCENHNLLRDIYCPICLKICVIITPSGTWDFCKIGSTKAIFLQVSKTSSVEQNHLFMKSQLTATTFVKKLYK